MSNGAVELVFVYVVPNPEAVEGHTQPNPDMQGSLGSDASDDFKDKCSVCVIEI